MATAKSDDESDGASHPLAENRPGVYVQVVAPRRRKKGKRGDSASSSHPPAGAEARSNTRQGKARGGVREETDARVTAREGSDPRAESDADSPNREQSTKSKKVASRAPAATDPRDVKVEAPIAALASEPSVSPAVPASESALDDEDDGRQSGERPVDFESLRTRQAESENTNDRPELLGMSIPPPPRLPSFSSPAKSEREIATDPPAHSASLLDAPHSLRPMADSTPAARSSTTLLAFVGVFSAIIVMAGLVALREVTKGDRAAGVRQAVRSAPMSPSAAPTPVVEALVAPTAQPSPAPASPHEASSARPALPLPAAVPSQGKAAGKAAAVRPAVKQPAAKALVAKANAALRNLKNTGVQATPGAASEQPEAAEDDDRVPGPDEPLELPVNPYR